jgi:hypothetical protein
MLDKIGIWRLDSGIWNLANEIPIPRQVRLAMTWKIIAKCYEHIKRHPSI